MIFNFGKSFRETIDAILRAISPNCRSEMESALQSQSDISDACKQEIQAFLRNYANPPPMMEEEQYDQDIPYDSMPKSKSRSPPPQRLVHPGLYIAGFLLVFFISLAAYIVYVNKELSSAFGDKKPKKLSKKKVRFKMLLID